MRTATPAGHRPLLAAAVILCLCLPVRYAVAAGNCALLAHYYAPMDLPVAAWPETIAGPPPSSIRKKLVGPDECRIIGEKIIHNASGVPYRLISMAISGSVFGYAPVDSLVVPPLGTGKKGEGQEFFFSDHAFIWQARGIMGPFVPGVAWYKYTKATPSGVDILIPQNPADWNGSMWVLVHGGGRYPPLRLPPREAGKFNRYTEASESASALIDRGYAVIWTRRDAATSKASSMDVANYAVLDDGRTVGGPGKPGMAFNENLGFMRDFTVISRNYVTQQLGKRPRAIFFRGHSAGGAMGRSFLLVKGMNTDHHGRKLFDGFYLDDSAGGRGAATYFWSAEVLDEHGTFRLHPSGTDHLVIDKDQLRFMSPVVETIHSEYAGGRTSTVPGVFERVPALYSNYKRENARINIEKGLDRIWKSYEIRGVSHGDAAVESEKYPELAKDMVDLGGVAGALEQALADWVLQGKPPPPTHVDAADVWELDPAAEPAIDLPDTACPRGVYRPNMKRPDGTAVGASEALFVPYATALHPQINEDQQRPPGYREEWLEPVDRHGYLVDLTGSHSRMTRPTIAQIWHLRYRRGEKTGILHPYEKLTRARYVECVTGVAAKLQADGVLTPEAARWYGEKAKTDDIGTE